MTPWESIEANREQACQIGLYTIGKLEYTTLQGLHVTGKLWIEFDSGEGMEVDANQIPEGVTAEWLDEFWRLNF